MKRETVVLFGASGTMGYQAFKELWKRRDRLDISLLLRPSARNRALFESYRRSADVPSITGPGVVHGNGFKIVWGDAAAYEDVEEAIKGADWVLSTMAVISPQADYYPQIAKAVNTDATVNLVRAIEAQPGGAERIKLIYTGTVAQTGDRLGCISWSRVGDPLAPSILDQYALTKIAGERAVLESNIKHWASLRMTFIMPTNRSPTGTANALHSNPIHRASVWTTATTRARPGSIWRTCAERLPSAEVPACRGRGTAICTPPRTGAALLVTISGANRTPS